MANERITLNGKSYIAKEIDFNFVCELGLAGIEVQDLSKKAIPALRTYIAYCMGADAAYAGEQINQHVVKGGTLDDIMNVFNAKADSSDFFRALGSGSDNETTSSTSSPATKEEDATALG